jgi:hypothetical protein
MRFISSDFFIKSLLLAPIDTSRNDFEFTHNFEELFKFVIVSRWVGILYDMELCSK